MIGFRRSVLEPVYDQLRVGDTALKPSSVLMYHEYIPLFARFRLVSPCLALAREIVNTFLARPKIRET